MKLSFALLCLGVSGNNRSSYGGRRRGSKKASAPALTAGYGSPNPNIESVNNLKNIGCQMAEMEDEYLMAIGGKYLKSFSNCGRCAEVACVGNACAMKDGKPMSVIARIVAQTTKSDNDKDIELNVAAWTEMMGARATMPSMTISWKYTSCPPPVDGRRKIYVHQDSNDKTYIVQPVNFEDPVKWMKFKNSAPKSKFSKPKTPLKGKVGFNGWLGKVKGKDPMEAPIFVDILMADAEGTRIKTKMTSWEPGKMSFPDGLPPNEDIDGPTQTKNDNMNFHVLGDIFGGTNEKTNDKPASAPVEAAPPAPPAKTTAKPTKTRKPKKSKKPKPSRDAPAHAPATNFFGAPSGVQESASNHQALNNFVFDILTPFEVPAAPEPVTTRKPTTTPKPVVTDIGVGFKTVTGVGAPASPRAGTCKVGSPQDDKLYASVNSSLNSGTCGKCVFIYCPGFSGCSGKPLKIQIVSEHSGSGDFALSKDAFKLITGKGFSAKERAAEYRSTVQIMGC